MRTLSRIRNGLLAGPAVAGALAVIASMLHVAADLVLRNLVNRPIPATYGIVTNYHMIPLAFIPLARVACGGGVIQVEVIETILSPRPMVLSDLIVAALSTVIYAAKALLRRIPGALAISSIFPCSGLAAVCGSSLAIAAAMGRIAIPEMV